MTPLSHLSRRGHEQRGYPLVWHWLPGAAPDAVLHINAKEVPAPTCNSKYTSFLEGLPCAPR
jgi:hypothetical protein